MACEETDGWEAVDSSDDHYWECSSKSASDHDPRTLLWSVPSWRACSRFQMLNLEIGVVHFRVAKLRHQNASQGIHDDYQDLLEDCHECSYKNISVDWGECRNCREVCEETEEDANTEERQRYY